jgi:competence protein ComEA
MIEVTLHYPDNQMKVIEVINFSTLEDIWSSLNCPTCDLRALNPHHVLKDGDHIVLRERAGMTVSLNQASLEDLMFLPGIGEVLAQRILDYRHEHGFFQNIEDIMLVRGIKVGLFSKIQPFLVL